MSSEQTLRSVLVVGGCGFLGHHIVSQILETDAASRVSVIDVNTARNRYTSVTYYDCDISSRKDVHDILQQIQPQVIIHTASPSPHSYSAALLEAVNVQGTQNLLESAQAIGTVEVFVYTSTASVLFDHVHDIYDGSEDLPVLYSPVQTDLYAHSKAVAEGLVLAANCNGSKMLTTSIRPSGLFGEGDTEFVMRLVETAKAGKSKIQMGNGKNLFDFTYVGNAAQAHILAAKALLQAFTSSPSIPEQSRVDGQAFLVTNDEPYPFWDFTRAVGAAAGYPVKKEEIFVIPRTIGILMGTLAEWFVWITSLGKKKATMSRKGINISCMNRTFRIEKVKKRLKYRPLVSMTEGIQRSAEWALGNRKTD